MFANYMIDDNSVHFYLLRMQDMQWSTSDSYSRQLN